MEIIVKDKTGKVKAHRGRRRIKAADGTIVNQEINHSTGRWRKRQKVNEDTIDQSRRIA